MAKDIRSLREEALKRHKAASRKVARLKREKGVEVAGTEFDPRVPVDKLKRYNSRQLQAYITRVNQFTRRTVQFVPDYRRRPVRAGTWRGYQAAEAQYNAYVQDRLRKVRDIVLPGGMTVEERLATKTPSHPVMSQEAVNAPYRKVARRSTSMYGADKIRAREQALRFKASEAGRRKDLADARKTLDRWIEVTGDTALGRQVAKLTDAQFEFLWNYTDFADNSSLRYHSAQAEIQKTGSDKQRAAFAKVGEDEHANARRLAEWVGKQDIRW
jgi:hypothetical protein